MFLPSVTTVHDLWCFMMNFPPCQSYKIHVKGGDGSPITYNKKQGHQRTARAVSCGSAEYLKPRCPLPPSSDLPFFTRKSPFWEKLTQLQVPFQDILRAETSISNLAAQSVILIRPFPSGGWGFCRLNFIKEPVGGPRTRSSEVRSVRDKPPGGAWLLYCEISPISSSS